jgi:hypothetical protein
LGLTQTEKKCCKKKKKLHIQGSSIIAGLSEEICQDEGDNLNDN